MGSTATIEHDIARWAGLSAFAGYEPWLQRLAEAPSLDAGQLAAVLQTQVKFDAQGGKLKAGLDSSDVDGSYADACARGVVPTRKNNLHDLLNALVWARFPLAKMALSVRQVALARARPPSTGERVRTREQDSCAMVDEGGMVIGPTQRAFFGHAALEDAVLGRDLRPFLLHVDTDDLDAGLAAVFADPRPLPRVRERDLWFSAGSRG